MPTTKSTSSAEENGAQFVLKHRIVGAAVLIFFSALFLPWLLGPPSEASKIDPVNQEGVDGVSQAIEEELLAAIESEQVVLDEEQVYISKITPLDVVTRELQEESVEDAQTKPVEASEKSKIDDAQAVKKESNASKPEKPSKAKPQLTKADANKIKPEAVPEAKADRQATDKQPAKSNNIDVGWVVQVGIYTNSDGVTKVMQDLRAKGFEPSTSTVDTNRGKGTGTRIWLGPFSQRVEAAKTKTRLTEKTGEAGFIRAYP